MGHPAVSQNPHFLRTLESSFARRTAEGGCPHIKPVSTSRLFLDEAGADAAEEVFAVGFGLG